MAASSEEGPDYMEFPPYDLIATEQDNNLNKMCCLQATVATGFEYLARDECKEVLRVKALMSRGKILFHIPIEMVHKAVEMRSIDNLYVVVYENKLSFKDNGANISKEESLAAIGKTLANSSDIIWEKALEVWRESSGDRRQLLSNKDLKFRVTCKRVGSSSVHSFGSPEAASYYGGRIQDRFNWKPDMTGFDIEVVLNVLANQIYVTLSLTRCSLHRRNICVFGSMTLRATIAHNMLRLARIQDGELVCDPMCGTGAIPIEGALCWPKARYLCGDNRDKIIPRAQQNVNKINDELKSSGKLPITLSVVCWDTTCLPLKSSSVDVFVTDLPFGKRSGSKADNRILYPKALHEMGRVCRTNTGRAVLLTQDRRTMIQTFKEMTSAWRVVHTITTNIGGLTAGVYLLHRTANEII